MPERELLARLLQRTKTHVNAPDNAVADAITRTVGEIIAERALGVLGESMSRQLLQQQSLGFPSQNLPVIRAGSPPVSPPSPGQNQPRPPGTSPPLTAVNRRGVPLLPGLLYGDREGRPDADGADAGPPAGHHARRRGVPALGRRRGARTPAATGPARRWRPTRCRGCPPSTPGSRPRWARSTPAGTGTPSCSRPSASRSRRCRWSCRWARPPATLPGSDAVITGGTIDALCDQIVAGATEPGRRARDLRGDADRVGGVRRVGGRRPG